MKHVSRSILVACAIVGSLLSGGSRVQAADEFGRRSGHPYLTYSDANIERLKERVRNEPAIADAWSKMLGDANRMITSSTGRRGRGGSTELLCLAYRMTGDKRFGERVKESLFKHQFGGRSASMLMKRNPPWHTGLDAGDKCHSFAIAYDTVYDLLTPEERKQLATRWPKRVSCPCSMTGSWAKSESTLWTPWGTTGGVPSSLVPGSLPWPLWTKIHVPKAGSNALAQPMPSGSATPVATWPANAPPSIVTVVSMKVSATPAMRSAAIFPSDWPGVMPLSNRCLNKMS